METCEELERLMEIGRAMVEAGRQAELLELIERLERLPRLDRDSIERLDIDS
jgi:hypothetical protein